MQSTRRAALAGLAGCILLVLAPLATAEAPVGYKTRARLQKLRKLALSGRTEMAEKAVEELRSMGEVAGPTLRSVAEEKLQLGARVIRKSARTITDLDRVRILEKNIHQLRAEARANIKKLAKDETLEKAREFYDELEKKTGLLAGVQKYRVAVLKALRDRPRWMKLYEAHAPEVAGRPRFTDETEAALLEQAEGVLGMKRDEALAIPPLGEGKPPAEGTRAWHLWYYRLCRDVEAYNHALAPLMSRGELENVDIVNGYREMLGVMPMEVDARLLQCARRHSKEMSDKGYFAHESPTPANKTFTRRAKNAGYGAARSENIHKGSSGGKGAFWSWFSSPPHHKNMVNPGHVQFGVGQWNVLWTQNFGTGRRLMLVSEADRRAVKVKGEILDPQHAAVAGR